MWTNRSFLQFGFISFFLLAALSAPIDAQSKEKPAQTANKPAMTTKIAKGTFEVKVTPVKDDDASIVEGMGRLTLNKTWSGELVGTSKGQMLGYSDKAQTTGGYVAMEVFTGTVNGKKGSFALQHVGTMEKGKFAINVEIIPGSGTADLTGITGKLEIIIADGKHSYELAYSLPK